MAFIFSDLVVFPVVRIQALSEGPLASSSW
jgi:hypothetical protein